MASLVQQGPLIILMTSLFPASIDALPNGAPYEACSDMTPQHGSRPREDPPPYFHRLSSDTYIPGVPISVSVSAYTGKYFKGFLIQAQLSDVGPDQGTVVGSFNAVPGTEQTCHSFAGLTHTNNKDKSNITFNWNPPPTLRGNIVFRTTFVHTKNSYWVGVRSQVISPGTVPTTTFTPTTTTSSRTSQPSSTFAESASTSASTVKVDTSRSSGGRTVSQDQTTSETTPTVGDVGGAMSITSSVTASFLCILFVMLMAYSKR